MNLKYGNHIATIIKNKNEKYILIDVWGVFGCKADYYLGVGNIGFC